MLCIVFGHIVIVIHANVLTPQSVKLQEQPFYFEEYCETNERQLEWSERVDS